MRDSGIVVRPDQQDSVISPRMDGLAPRSIIIDLRERRGDIGLNVPIVDFVGSPMMFAVEHGGWGRVLEGVRGNLDEGWCGRDHKFAFRTDAPAAASSSVWTPNREIQIGTCKDKQAMRAALEAAGRRVMEQARDMLAHVNYSPEVRTINLVWPGVDELGLDEWATVEQIHNRGLERGLELCEWEDGPQLAAQYLDQPIGEKIYMAMEPIVGPEGSRRLFAVGHDDGRWGRWLKGRWGHPGDSYRGRDRFAFRCK